MGELVGSSLIRERDESRGGQIEAVRLHTQLSPPADLASVWAAQ